MKIILLDKIQRLGEIGDVVEVNSGYARNFLIPQKKAAFASEKNIAEVEAKKDELAAMSADILTKAQSRAKDIEGSECEILVPVTEEGALYGSVGTREISEAFTAKDIEIDKSEIQLPDGPIKEINQKTDIKITYENIKRGRTVTGLTFTVKAKPTKKKGQEGLNQNNEDRDIPPLTVKQIDRFAPLLANYSPFGSYAPSGKSTQEVISWLHTQLRDEAFLKTHKKHLLAIGYTFPKQKS